MLRPTYAMLDQVTYRSKSATTILGISDTSLRNNLKDAGLEVPRANSTNPNSPAVRQFSVQDIFKLVEWRRNQGLVKKLSHTPICIATAINKGGTGKSTTSAEIGIQLALDGYKVLLIDLDVQSNATQLFGYESDFSLEEAEANGLSSDAIVQTTFRDVIRSYCDARNTRGGKMPNVASAIKKPFGEAGPSLIPADSFLNDLEQSLVLERGNRELVFKSFFQDSAEGKVPGFNITDYDFVIFDCPPSNQFSSLNAIAAADLVIAPLKMDSFGIKGMSHLISEINGLSQRMPDIRPDLLILPTHYSTQISRVARMQSQLQAYKDNLSETVISASELFPKSQENYLPLTLQSPSAPGVAEYRQVTNYIVAKFLKKDTK